MTDTDIQIEITKHGITFIFTTDQGKTFKSSLSKENAIKFANTILEEVKRLQGE